jgi:hypothetical protein
MQRPSPSTIHQVDTSYKGIPGHRGHTVEIQGWNDEYVMLVIHSATRTNEAIISPSQLRELADVAEREVRKW